MRKVTFGVANSLDNYIARDDGAVDWLLWSDDLTRIMEDYWKTIDTILMGRKTYEFALAHGGANPFGLKTYVFSRTLAGDHTDDVEIVSEDAPEFVRRLKRRKGKDICLLGGGELAKSLFDAKLIDEVGLNIQPVLLGSGVPLFREMKRQIDLELIACETLKKGCVYVTYRVKK
ncbi:MAG: dihydrofolate reductase family protein [Acidobacteriota bacterium]|nr:dihydrofolate reductase family protein [Acidobacteriota bacterium]